MFVIFKSDHDERLINTNKINIIWEDKASKKPCFYIEPSGSGVFSFNSIEWNGLTKECVTLNDVWVALRYFERKNEEK